MKKKAKFLISLTISLILFGCKKDDIKGKNSLVDLIAEPSGNNCTSGGYKINSGVDLNSNNKLDPSEVEQSEYICNGNDGTTGLSSLISIISEPSGTQCSNGGYKIIVGLDSNRNNVLDPNETQNTEFICNGKKGYNSLFTINPEPTGNNCKTGGFKINYGIDSNNDGILQKSEINDFVYICNGNNGNKETRISIEWTANTQNSTGVKGIGIYDFDKENFTGVDSIIFVGAPYSGNIGSNSIIELYDFTSNQIIPGASIKSNKDYNKTSNKHTKNLFHLIPKGKRDIGIKLRSEVEGEFSGMKGNCYLYLYR